jgi:hypothetical protein
MVHRTGLFFTSFEFQEPESQSLKLAASISDLPRKAQQLSASISALAPTPGVPRELVTWYANLFIDYPPTTYILGLSMLACPSGWANL